MSKPTNDKGLPKFSEIELQRPGVTLCYRTSCLGDMYYLTREDLIDAYLQEYQNIELARFVKGMTTEPSQNVVEAYWDQFIEREIRFWEAPPNGWINGQREFPVMRFLYVRNVTGGSPGNNIARKDLRAQFVTEIIEAKNQGLIVW